MLHRVIQNCGLEDCGELVALATPGQLAHVLDVDLWRPATAGGDDTLDAERFGVAELDGTRIIGIEEKPRQPKSNYAVTGIYMYDRTVFEKVRELVPSGRGELEITDVNNAYIREGTMTFSYVEGWWTDAGTFESLLRAANLVAQSRSPRQRAEASAD